MADIVFPTTAAIANTIPTNGNTVPISGTHAITNHYEMFMYSALSLENIHLGDNINFGNITLPAVSITKSSALNGLMYFNVQAFVQMKPNYAAFPDGAKLWKQVIQRLPNNPAASEFNF